MYFNVDPRELSVFELAVNDFEHGKISGIFDLFGLKSNSDYENTIKINKENHTQIIPALLAFADSIE